MEGVNALMSCNISHALKSKIINSQYFDLALLLDNTSLSNDSFYFNKKGELVTEEGDKASNKITTINNWLMHLSCMVASMHKPILHQCRAYSST